LLIFRFEGETLTAAHPVILGRGREYGFERGDNSRVELALNCLSEPKSSDTAGHGVTVRAI
jgi:hypothetical protein